MSERESVTEPEHDRGMANPIVKYLGQASLRIVTEQGKVIYVDPYAGDDYSLGADLILVTHEHFDHNAVEVVSERNEGWQIIRSSDVISDGRHKTFLLEFVTVEAVEAGNNPYHDIKNCVGYVLTYSILNFLPKRWRGLLHLTEKAAFLLGHTKKSPNGSAGTSSLIKSAHPV